MENSYGIGVKNRYELFLNDAEDLTEILKTKDQDKDKKKKKVAPSGPEKENKTKGPLPVKGKVIASKKIIKDNIKGAETDKIEKFSKGDNQEFPRTRPLRGPNERNVKFSSTPEAREERNNRRNRDERPERVFSTEFRGNRESAPPPRFESERGRGRGRGGRGRGRGRGAFDVRGKREYDRQSGSDKTGVKSIDKREGGGSFNWGREDEILDTSNNTEQFQNITPFAETNNDSWGDAPLDTSDPPEIKEPDSKPLEEMSAEEAAREMTLDEWKMLQEASRARPHYNLRKPGEGEDNSQWKKAVMLKKKEEEEEDDEDEDDEDDEDEGRRGRQKQQLDIQFIFPDNRRARGRGRGGRGIRGGPRPGAPGRGMRGGGNGPGGGDRPGMSGTLRDRGERPERGVRQSAPRVDDETDFPSL